MYKNTINNYVTLSLKLFNFYPISVLIYSKNKRNILGDKITRSIRYIFGEFHKNSDNTALYSLPLI